MAKTGEELGVCLSDLWRCAMSALPLLADRATNANRAVASAAAPGDTSRIYPLLAEVRDEFQNILAQSSENVYESAAALADIVKRYAESDDAARQAFDTQRSQFGLPPLTESAPPQPPVRHAPRPSDTPGQ
jgi:hypothetical protein